MPYRAQFLSRSAEKALRSIAREGRKWGGIGIYVYRAGTHVSITSSRCMGDPFIFAVDGATGVVDIEIVYAAGSRKSTSIDLDAMGCKPYDSDERSHDWFEKNKSHIRRYMRG